MREVALGLRDITERMYNVSLGPRPFLGRKNGLVQSVHACVKNSVKITVKSLVYVEMKYTAEVFGTRLLLHV